MRLLDSASQGAHSLRGRQVPIYELRNAESRRIDLTSSFDTPLKTILLMLRCVVILFEREIVGIQYIKKEKTNTKIK